MRRAQVQLNGASFHVIEQGRGPAVLFCHGFPETAETWRSQMQAVADAGYHAVALDMRGFGASYALADASLYYLDDFLHRTLLQTSADSSDLRQSTA